MEVELTAFHEAFSELDLPAVQLLPECYRVLVVELACFDDELAVVLEAHASVLGVGVGGEEGGGPEEGLKF